MGNRWVFVAAIELVEERSGAGGRDGGATSSSGAVFASLFEFVFVFDLDLDLAGLSSQHFGCITSHSPTRFLCIVPFYE